MPNALDATYGQWHQKASRHETFWRELTRVAEQIARKTDHFQERLKQSLRSGNPIAAGEMPPLPQKKETFM
jgi:hypothetical protein